MITSDNAYVYSSANKRATLLIPDYMDQFFEELLIKSGGLKNLLKILLIKFQNPEKKFLLKHKISSCIVYQEKGLSLCRKDFRPFEDDWVNIKLIANSYNLSICNFFVILVGLELAGVFDESKSGGVPPKFPKIVYHQKLTFYSIPKFYRKLILRI